MQAFQLPQPPDKVASALLLLCDLDIGGIQGASPSSSSSHRSALVPTRLPTPSPI